MENEMTGEDIKNIIVGCGIGAAVLVLTLLFISASETSGMRGGTAIWVLAGVVAVGAFAWNLLKNVRITFHRGN